MRYLLELACEDIFEELTDKRESLTQSDDSCLCKQLYLLHNRPNICSHSEGDGNFSKVRKDEGLKVVCTHCHYEFQTCEHATIKIETVKENLR